MRNYRTKEDGVAKISTSIFVTKFPESFSAKDLFQSCKQYGHVVDTFIPNKRSKADMRFGFVRFINVFNDESVISMQVMVRDQKIVQEASFYLELLRGESGNNDSEAYPLLEKIKLKRMVVSDEGLETIGGVFDVLRNLRELDLPESEGKDLSGHWLSYFPNAYTSLESLNMYCLSSEVSLSALQRLVARSPNLKTLRLNRAVQLEKAFSKCKELKSLSGFWDVDPYYLPVFYSVCSRLTFLNLSYATIESPNVRKIISQCPNLQRLCVRNSYVYDPNPNSFDCPPDSYHPPYPTYETYSYDSYGNDSKFSYDCQPQFLLNYESKPGYNENYNSYPYDSSSLPQQYPCCTRCGGPHETCQCDQLIFDEPYCKHCGGPHMNYQCQPNSLGFDQPQPPQSPVIHQPPQELSIQEMEDLKQQYLDELKRLSNPEYRDEIKIVELTKNFNGMSIEIRKKEKLLQQEQWAFLSTHPSKRLTSFCYDDDDDEDYTSAITPDEPVLSTEEPDNSLSMGDEHLDTIPATKSDKVIKSSVENLNPILSESEGIPDHVCDVPSHDNSPPLDVSTDQSKDFSESNEEFSSIDDDSFSIDNIDYVEASPPDSELESSYVMEIVIPEVGGIDDDILLTIKDDIIREKLLNVNILIAKIEALNDNPTPSSDCKTNSGSTTTHSDISLLKYKVFYDDHVKEISSGSPTTHSNSPFYASFIFDLSINPFPPADRSDFYEFTDELSPFISPPEYDCFLFNVEPNSGDFTKDVVEDISPTKETQVLNALPTHPTLQLNMKFQPSSESLFTYVVWIFLSFLVYSVARHYLLSLRNEDAIFDPGICNSYFFRPDVSHWCGTVKKFNIHRSHLNECPMLINGQNNPILDVLLFHFYPL
uniref:RRM domain-containing protein n=1 Tax=Tanacetum cinerariifolium TaxID=118510 RepID=A0A6L2NSX3_TANCI|nr:hypothetical protein [Tanacetum cinerariifolium]